MGDTSSDWNGVSWEATAAVAAGSYEPLTSVSASNTDFVAATTANYGSDSMFWGQINYSDSTDAWVEIIRQTPRSEQTLTDGSVTRIELDRSLIMCFVDGDDDYVYETFTLTSAFSTMSSVTVIALALVIT